MFKRIFSNKKNHLPSKLLVGSLVLFLLIQFAILWSESGNESFSDPLDALWWAVVTITTTGYGDQIPQSLLGRATGIVTMVFGVVIVSIATGRISSFLVDQKLREGKGLKELKFLKDHILICGFKSDLKYLINDILYFESGTHLSDLVLINAIGQDKMSSFLLDDSLKGINYLHGDTSDESVLLRANVKMASKALVLSEPREGDDTEAIDARVLVTVLMIRSLNPNIYICAEVLTVKYKNYLEHMRCDEVVLSEEYTRFLLANATVFSGITKVVSKLLNNGEGNTLKLEPLPLEMIDLSFSEIAQRIKDQRNAILIGIVENMGIEREFKQNALTEAQKTPDISTLVRNLKGIHDMERNKTVINPSDDYIVRKNSGLILISR